MVAEHKGFPIQITARRLPSNRDRWYLYATVFHLGSMPNGAGE